MEDIPYTPEHHPTDSFRHAVANYYAAVSKLQGWEVRFMRDQIMTLVAEWDYDVSTEYIDYHFSEQLLERGNEQTFIDAMITLPLDVMHYSAREELEVPEYRAWLGMMVNQIIAATNSVHKKDVCLDSPTFAGHYDTCDVSYQCPYVATRKVLEHNTIAMLVQPEDRKILKDEYGGDLDEEDFSRAEAELWVSHHAGLTPDYQLRWFEEALKPRLADHRHTDAMRILFSNQNDDD